jgi:hypothetical protein
MRAIRADDLAAFAPGRARLVAGKLVRGALLMSRLAAFAGDFALLALIHTRKPSSADSLTIHNYKPL